MFVHIHARIDQDIYTLDRLLLIYIFNTKPKRELPESPTTNVRTTSPGLLTPTTYRIAMMIAAKNGTVTTTTAAMMTVRKARGPGNFVNADQITPYTTDQMFCLKLSHALIFSNPHISP